ncbi:hypothetical protein ACIBO5_36850 [Nonomuraea angiospora]|uniref:hypothetical protein n=1 Tax=Nonomuraea angiospora TaxID=46172 RepID=UPI0029A746F6|nr:hypothetical protein [Nonomuraea angiospora]MDX3107149.1 hypothetical protein [Nonomuraea angiospora]
MFKRRLALLGAVAVLAITGLTGSALADETPATAGAKVTCKTADGKTVEVAEFARTAPVGKVVGPDGKVREFKPSDTVKVDALPDGEVPQDVTEAGPALPDGVEVTKTVPLPEDGKLPDGMRAVPAQPVKPGEKVDAPSVAIEAVPAQPVKPGEKLDAPSVAIKAVKIICEKTD